jgi:pimeloyl-ACP methyl ester carboxylesterase
MLFRTVLIVICLSSTFSGCSPPQTATPIAPATIEYLRVDPVTILDKSGEPLTYLTDRPERPGRFPLVIIVDGSTCRGWQTVGLDKWLQPDETAPRPFARIFVEKRGVPSDSTGQDGCSDTFLKNFSIDKRVEDHLRVLQHVRAHADWWDGTLYIAGWSDGGDIAAQLTAYYPGVDRALLGAMGGGTTMAEQFRDKFVCPEDRFDEAEDRTACVTELAGTFQEMTDNPTWTQTWGGPDNSHRVWASRLHTRLTHLLKDVTAPILIVHGAEGFDNVPVESARALVNALTDAGQDTFTYWEVPGMKHGPASLPEDRIQPLMTAMRDWLLLGETVAMP